MLFDLCRNEDGKACVKTFFEVKYYFDKNISIKVISNPGSQKNNINNSILLHFIIERFEPSLI